MLFRDILGFADTKNKLIKAFNSNHLAHALLFSGKEGSPNLPMALAFATFLNCENRLPDDACGECASCRKSTKYVHPDVHFAFPVSATKGISGKDVVSVSYLKEWREFLLKKPYGDLNDWNTFFGGENKQVLISREESRHIVRNLSLKAFEGNFKIMLIWLPELMNAAAANAILKILEEPTEKTIFLLVTNNSEQLITTILSRTQLFHIRNFNDDEISEYLNQNSEIDSTRISQITHLANGNLNAAFKLLSDVEDDSHEVFRDWMRLCYVKDYSNLVAWTDKFQKLNKIEQKSVFQYGMNIMREVLVGFYDNDRLLRLQGAEKEFVDNFSKVMDAEKVDLITQHLNQATYHLERNANVKILFLDLSLAIARIIRN